MKPFEQDNWYWEMQLECDEDRAELISTYLFENGATGTEELPNEISRARFKVYFTSEAPNPQHLLDQWNAQETLADKKACCLSINQKPMENWQENWQQHFKAIEIGRQFVVAPPWEEIITNRKTIFIQPGFGFGTGYHESTHLALQLLEEYSDRSPLKSVLDVGTGSGILAIAAVLLGADSVHAIDIDEDAIQEVMGNCDQSHIDSTRIDLTTGSVSDLNSDPFDLLLANIEDFLLIPLVNHLLRLTKSGGAMLLSGILTEKKQSVIEALEGNAVVTSERQLNEWTAFLLERP